MISNLTEGELLKSLFFFAIPMVTGNLFQQLYNMVGSTVVGRFVGEDALAAVGSSFPTVLLSVAVAIGLSMGCTVMISQFLGMGEIREMKVTVSTILISLGVIGLIIMGIGELAADPLLKLLGIGPDIMADSLAYPRIYFRGAIFPFLYNSLSGIHNALGDSQTSPKFLMVSAPTDIVLDLPSVIKFNMGVAGVARAILVAQGFCACISFFVPMGHLRKMEDEPSTRRATFVYFNTDVVRRTTKVGVPSMLQQSIMSVSTVMMQGLVNSYGKVSVVSYTAAAKIGTLAMPPNMNFPSVISSYTVQNIDAGKVDRAKQRYKSYMFVVFIFLLTIATLIYLLGPRFLGLFPNQGAKGSAMSYGLKYMKTVSVFYLLTGILFVGNGLLRGVGDMDAFMLGSMVSLFSRVAITYPLARYIGISAIWWSIPTDWASGFMFSFLRIKNGRWMSKSLVE